VGARAVMVLDVRTCEELQCCTCDGPELGGSWTGWSSSIGFLGTVSHVQYNTVRRYEREFCVSLLTSLHSCEIVSGCASGNPKVKAREI
jgi:hypothetical protein